MPGSMNVNTLNLSQLVSIAESGVSDVQALAVQKNNGKQTFVAASNRGTALRTLCGDFISGEEEQLAKAIQKSLAERVGTQTARDLVSKWYSNIDDGLIRVRDVRTLLSELKAIDHSDSLLKGLGKHDLQALNVLRDLHASSDLKGFSNQIRRVLENGGKSEAALRSLLMQASNLLETHAFSPTGTATQIGDLARLKFETNLFVKLFESDPSEGCREMATRLRELTNRLQTQKQLLVEQFSTSTTLAENLRPAQEARYKATITVLAEKVMSLPERLSEAEIRRRNLLPQLATLGAQLQEELAAIKRQNSHTLTQEELQTFEALPKNLSERLARLLPESERKGLTEELNEAYRQQLNRNPWNVISRDIPMFDAKGGMETLNSKMVPSNQLGNGETLRRDGISGVGSGDRKNVHANNLWASELTIKQPDGQNKTLFKGMRHGVMDAFGIKDPIARREANIKRVKEFYVATLHAQPQLLDKAKKGEVVDLPIVSTSLLGPNWFMRKEKTMLANQTQAWMNACNEDKVCELEVNGEKLQVRPKLITFNYAVDGWSQSLGLHAWRSTNAMNEEGLRQLIGDPSSRGPVSENCFVGQFLHNCQNEDLKNKVQQLVGQIRDLHTTGRYKKWRADPYAMPARIALLAHLTGAMPAYNCKSGKDRTGQLDVAVKTLAFMLDQGMLPDPQKSPTKEAMLIMNKLAANSGNMEVQQYNTGVAGSKTAGISKPRGLRKQFSDDAFEYYKGLEAYAKS